MLRIDGSVTDANTDAKGMISLEAEMQGITKESYPKIANVLDTLKNQYESAYNFVTAILASKPLSGQVVKRGYYFNNLRDALEHKAPFNAFPGKPKLNMRFDDAFTQAWGKEYPNDAEPSIHLSATTGLFELITGASIAVPSHLQKQLVNEFKKDLAKNAKDMAPGLGGAALVALFVAGMLFLSTLRR